MKLPDTYYREAADKLNLPISLIKSVNNFYWKNGIKKNLSNVSYNSLFIKNFGTIVISKYKLNKEILTIILKIRNIRKSEKFRQETKDMMIEGYKNNLRKLWKKRNDIIKENN